MHLKKYDFFTYIDNLNQENIINLNININIILRNYEKKFGKNELIKFVKFCKKNKRKIYLANDIKKAKALDFNGAYIPSFNKIAYNYNLGKKNGFQLLGSAHNVQEILIKINQKIDIIFLSSLFKNSKKKKNLGIVKFKLLQKNFNKKFIALGGINKKNIKILDMLKISGYAAISHFSVYNNI